MFRTSGLILTLCSRTFRQYFVELLRILVLPYLLLIAFFICVAGIFAASETALLTAPKSRIRELMDGGSALARLVHQFQSDPENLLATVKVGFIISLSMASVIAGLYAINAVAPTFMLSNNPFLAEFSHAIAVGIVIVFFSLIAITVGELVPKSLTLRWPIRVALAVVVPLRFLSFIFRPAFWLVRLLSNLILKPFKDQTSFSESRISEEEFRLLLDEGKKTGVIDRTEHELISSIFEFTDTTAKEVMVPRTDIVGVSIDAPRERVLRIVMEEGYSRLPVYKGSTDNILGIIYTKDLISLLEHRDLILLQDIIRPAYFVPENKKISTLLRELQEKKQHMAVVIDEYGGTEGIITMEDIIEEIVGEIHDEYDEVVREVESSPDGSALVNGRITIRDFNEKFDVDVPEDVEYDTLSGFLCKVTGHIPEQNEEIAYRNLHFTIVKKSQRRLRQVKVRKLSDIDLPDDETGSRLS